MISRTLTLRLLSIAAVALPIVLWELASGRLIAPFWISSPTAVAKTLGGWISSGLLWPHLGATLFATFAGYAIGAFSGVALGLLLGFMPKVRAVAIPYLAGLYALPKIALAPLFIILLGIGLLSKVVFVAITVFFILLYATIDGIVNGDKDIVESVVLMGAKRYEIASKVMIPGALPWIFTGLRISVRYAFTGAILAEMIAANRGLGFLIESHAGMYDVSGVFSGVVVVVIISMALTMLLMALEKRSRPA